MGNETNRGTTPDDVIREHVVRLVDRGGPFEIVNVESAPPRFRRGAGDLRSLFHRVKLLHSRVQLKSSREFTFGDIARESSRFDSPATLSEQYIGIGDGDPFRGMAEIMSAVDRGKVAVPVSGSEHVEAFRRYTGHSLILEGSVEEEARSVSEEWPSPTILQTENILHDYSRRPAVVLFTSGTSGTPKPVFHSHESILSGLNNMLLAGSISAFHNGSVVARQNGTPSVLLICPLSYIAGIAQFFLSFLLGCKIIIPVDHSIDGLASAIEQNQVSSIVGINREQLSQLLHIPKLEVIAGSVRNIHVYGETLPIEQIIEFTKILPNVRFGQGYGMTEAFGPVAAFVLEDAGGPIFWKLPSIEAAVLSKYGLKSSGTGRLHIRGRNMMLGYDLLQCPATSYDWFDTGDEVELSELGKMRVLDRSSRSVESDDGNRTYFADIERCALQESARDAVAWSDSGVNATGVYLAIVTDPSNKDRIQRALAERFSFNIILLFVPSIPRRHGGKIDMEALKNTTY